MPDVKFPWYSHGVHIRCEDMQRCIEKRELVSLALEPLGDSLEPDMPWSVVTHLALRLLRNSSLNSRKKFLDLSLNSAAMFGQLLRGVPVFRFRL